MITDDAGVVGEGALQVETWLKLDSDALEHWLVAAYGSISVLELSAGTVHGTELADSAYALRGPLLQLKALALEPQPAGMPGVAFAAGAAAPWGFGGFEADVFGAYVYAAGTVSPRGDERLLLHVNLGVVRGRLDCEGFTSPTWAAGAMAFLAEPVGLFAELASGDPDTEEQDGVLHGGMKYQFIETAHLDATLGAGIWGKEKLPLFATLGFRWATE